MRDRSCHVSTDAFSLGLSVDVALADSSPRLRCALSRADDAHGAPRLGDNVPSKTAGRFYFFLWPLLSRIFRVDFWPTASH